LKKENKSILNVGIIGMGIGQQHAIAYDKHPNFHIKALCDFDLNKLESIKNSYPSTLFTDNYKNIINDKEISVVSVASFDNFHATQIIESINNHKHVFAEKPLCLTVEELKEIDKALRLNPEIKLSSNHVLRTNPRFLMMREKIKRGDFGDIFYLEGDYYWGRIHKFNEWRAKMDYYSIIHGAAIHMIDLVMWLINDRPVEVQAVGNAIATKKHLLDYNSFAVLIMKFKNGILAKVTGNGGCVHPHHHGLKIFGTQLTAIQNISDAYFIESSDENMLSNSIKEPYPAKDQRHNILTSYIDSIIDTSKSPIITQKDVFDVMSVCFASEEAMETGKTVSVNYFD